MLNVGKMAYSNGYIPKHDFYGEPSYTTEDKDELNLKEKILPMKRRIEFHRENLFLKMNRPPVSFIDDSIGL